MDVHFGGLRDPEIGVFGLKTGKKCQFSDPGKILKMTFIFRIFDFPAFFVKPAVDALGLKDLRHFTTKMAKNSHF